MDKHKSYNDCIKSCNYMYHLNVATRGAATRGVVLNIQRNEACERMCERKYIKTHEKPHTKKWV